MDLQRIQNSINSIKPRSMFFILMSLLSLSKLFCVPQVNNLFASQRNDPSKKVDVYFDLSHNMTVTVSIYASLDNGITWNLPIILVSGDVGPNIDPGNGKHIVWDVLAEHPNIIYENVKFKLWASDSQNASLLDNLAAYWKLDEGYGSVLHDSSSGFVGSAFNHSWQIGVFNSSLAFNGTSSYAILPKSLQDTGTSPFTMNIWIKAGSQIGGTHNYAGIIVSGTIAFPFTGTTVFFGTGQNGEGINKMTFRLDSNNNLFFEHAAVSDYNWHMWTFVRESSTSLALYLDGIFVKRVSVNPVNVSIATHGISLGCNHHVFNSQNLNGNLDEFAIWYRSLSENEIYCLYNNGIGLSFPF